MGLKTRTRCSGSTLYTAGEAARLIDVPAARIRRWLGGYEFRHGNDNRRLEALWTPQVPRLGREVELGFRDLIELKLVDAFEKAGFSLQASQGIVDRQLTHRRVAPLLDGTVSHGRSDIVPPSGRRRWRADIAGHPAQTVCLRADDRAELS